MGRKNALRGAISSCGPARARSSGVLAVPGGARRAARPQSAAPRHRPRWRPACWLACSWRRPPERRFAAQAAGHASYVSALHTQQEQLATRHQVRAVLTQDASRGQRVHGQRQRADPGRLDLRHRRAARSGAVPAEPGSPQGDGRHRLDRWQRLPGQPAADRLRGRGPGRRGHGRRDRRDRHRAAWPGRGPSGSCSTAAGWPPGTPTGWLRRRRGTIRAGDAGRLASAPAACGLTTTGGVDRLTDRSGLPASR